MQAATDWRERVRSWTRGIRALDPRIQAALIVAVAMLTAVALYLYFSPYHACVRAFEAAGAQPSVAHWRCVGGTTRR